MTSNKVTFGILAATLLLAGGMHMVTDKKPGPETPEIPDYALKTAIHSAFNCQAGDYILDGVKYSIKPAQDPYCEVNGELIPYDQMKQLEGKFIDTINARRKVLRGAAESDVLTETVKMNDMKQLSING